MQSTLWDTYYLKYSSMGHLDHLLAKIIKVNSYITAVHQKARQLNHSILPCTAHFIFILTKFQFNVISIKAEISQGTWIGSVVYHLFNCSVVSDYLWPHELQHTRLPCPSRTSSPGACSNSCPLSQWCHPTILSFVGPLLLLPSIFPSIRVFSNESTLETFRGLCQCVRSISWLLLVFEGPELVDWLPGYVFLGYDLWDSFGHGV